MKVDLPSLIHRAQQQTDIILEEALITDGVALTVRQYVVMNTVLDHGLINQTGIVEKTGIDRSTLADIVRRLVKRGLLARKRSKSDARNKYVSLTENGQSVLKNVRHHYDRAHRQMVAGISAADLEAAERVLTRLATARAQL